jgi:hypothetical protein
MTRKTISVDFDGVLHSYTSRWQGPTLIPDLPVPRAIEFLRKTTKQYDVAIFSSRSHQPGGIAAMTDWLNFHGLPREWIAANLTFPSVKPPAHVTLDDRAIQFTGRFPSLAEIDAFQPWNRLENSLTDLQDDLLPVERLSSEVMLCLHSRNISRDIKLKLLGIAAATILVSEAPSHADIRNTVDWFTNKFELAVATALQIPEVKKHFES